MKALSEELLHSTFLLGLDVENLVEKHGAGALCAYLWANGNNDATSRQR